MEQDKKMFTIAEMTKAHFAEHPEQPPESIDEYFLISSIEEEKVKEIKLKFENSPEYYKQFQDAILHTSFMIMLLVKKTLNPDTSADLEQYTREFLFFARKDDRDIYIMRLYYINSLTANELEIGHLEEEDLSELSDQMEKDLVIKEAENKKSYYSNLLSNMKNQYCESKIHLS